MVVTNHFTSFPPLSLFPSNWLRAGGVGRGRKPVEAMAEGISGRSPQPMATTATWGFSWGSTSISDESCGWLPASPISFSSSCTLGSSMGDGFHLMRPSQPPRQKQAPVPRASSASLQLAKAAGGYSLDVAEAGGTTGAGASESTTAGYEPTTKIITATSAATHVAVPATDAAGPAALATSITET